jgi:hypothetical protein
MKRGFSAIAVLAIGCGPVVKVSPRDGLAYVWIAPGDYVYAQAVVICQGLLDWPDGVTQAAYL